MVITIKIFFSSTTGLISLKHLVCSIVYTRTAKIGQIMIQDLSWHLLHQGQIWLLWLLSWKKVKISYFSETIAAYDLKVSKCIQLSE